MTAPRKADVAQAAAVLREVLARVDSGELEAPGARGSAVVRRLQGALLGLETASDRPRDERA
jgi:hypothetical protein